MKKSEASEYQRLRRSMKLAVHEAQRRGDCGTASALTRVLNEFRLDKPAGASSYGLMYWLWRPVHRSNAVSRLPATRERT